MKWGYFRWRLGDRIMIGFIRYRFQCQHFEEENGLLPNTILYLEAASILAYCFLAAKK